MNVFFEFLLAAALIVMTCLGTAALVLLCMAGCFRCKKCRGWHDNALDEERCNGDD